VWITSSLTTAITPTAIALGNFDGVHLGHRSVIAPVVPQPQPKVLTPSAGEECLASDVTLRGLSARQPDSGRTPSPDFTNSAPYNSSKASPPNRSPHPVPTVMTFFPHPQEFFSGQARPLLTPLPEKAIQISRLGVEQLVLLPFDRHLANLSPEEFVTLLLVKQLRVQRISVGKDFCFGQGRRGTVEDLIALATRYGIQVHVAPLVDWGPDRISSSRIRQALATADLASAQALLGRPYSLTGRVVQGQQLARTLGFPTANLHLPADKFLPQTGVYSGWVQGATPTPYPLLPAVMNLGTRPTVQGQTLTAEVHLFNWQGDLYGKTLEIHLHSFLRPEQKFDSLDDLKRQIHHDCQRALGELARSPH
jgi:riboflavin kinase / FMN adenylyltransferase